MYSTEPLSADLARDCPQCATGRLFSPLMAATNVPPPARRAAKWGDSVVVARIPLKYSKNLAKTGGSFLFDCLFDFTEKLDHLYSFIKQSLAGRNVEITRH